MTTGRIAAHNEGASSVYWRSEVRSRRSEGNIGLGHYFTAFSNVTLAFGLVVIVYALVVHMSPAATYAAACGGSKTVKLLRRRRK